MWFLLHHDSCFIYYICTRRKISLLKCWEFQFGEVSSKNKNRSSIARCQPPRWNKLLKGMLYLAWAQTSCKNNNGEELVLDGSSCWMFAWEVPSTTSSAASNPNLPASSSSSYCLQWPAVNISHLDLQKSHTHPRHSGCQHHSNCWTSLRNSEVLFFSGSYLYTEYLWLDSRKKCRQRSKRNVNKRKWGSIYRLVRCLESQRRKCWWWPSCWQQTGWRLFLRRIAVLL